MDVDTTAVRAIGAELEMIALGWAGATMAGEPVAGLQGSFGTSPQGTELAESLRTFTRRAQSALRDLSTRVAAAGRAFGVTAARFESTEESLSRSRR
ncbi:hypothetical protein [Nakamurella lactea]|uniref:hypothetical protein n=1 Tax=Nakamurella lactea TaxID=459515 RepID=UPI0004014B12|nr:hypothetical protein [Nakamurella lactea]